MRGRRVLVSLFLMSPFFECFSEDIRVVDEVLDQCLNCLLCLVGEALPTVAAIGGNRSVDVMTLGTLAGFK